MTKTKRNLQNENENIEIQIENSNSNSSEKKLKITKKKFNKEELRDSSDSDSDSDEFEFEQGEGEGEGDNFTSNEPTVSYSSRANQDEEIIDNLTDDDDVELAQDGDLENKMENLAVYLPGGKLHEGEELVADQSTYDMLHKMNVEWPCLSFDIIPDKNINKDYPLTTYLVAGSQAESVADNKLYVMKMSNMKKTIHDDDSDEDDEDEIDNGLGLDPVLEYRIIPHLSSVNRVRVMPDPEIHLTATMAESGLLYIFDTTPHIRSLDTPGCVAPKNTLPIYSSSSHSSEGYALDWAPKGSGSRCLASGDCDGGLYITVMGQGGGFVSDKRGKGLKGHSGSVEDLQWSPNQSTVLASCSADQTIRIWDLRVKSKPQLTIHAHDSDVNVISWNKTVDYLLASGSDSGEFSVWDLRNWPTRTSPQKGFSRPDTAATFSWHKAPISSIEWHPTDSSVLAVSGADDQLTLWDLALERDAEEEVSFAINEDQEKVEVPAQLLFIHMGQKNVKELHWHPQLSGVVVATAFDGFNVFKTFNMQ